MSFHDVTDENLNYQWTFQKWSIELLKLFKKIK